jgi:hypothetical protein
MAETKGRNSCAKLFPETSVERRLLFGAVTHSGPKTTPDGAANCWIWSHRSLEHSARNLELLLALHRLASYLVQFRQDSDDDHNYTVTDVK